MQILLLHDFLSGMRERFLKNGKFLQKSLSTTVNETIQRGQSNLTEVMELVSGEAGI